MGEIRKIAVAPAIQVGYKQHAKGKDKFSKFVDRIKLEQLQQLVG